MSAVTAAAVFTEGRVQLVDEFAYRACVKRAGKKWGEGAALIVRVEPEDEAWRYSDAKHLYGHLYTPVSQRTGEPVSEVHWRMKAAYFPEDGRTSLTQLNREEMKTYIESVEQDIRETDPDSWEDCIAAMSLYEQKAAKGRVN